MMQETDLPDGWTSASLGDLCSDVQYGWTTSAQKSGQGLKLLRTTDISSGEVDWTQVPECREEPEDPHKYLLGQGDIVVSRAGSVGISYLIRSCPAAVFASYLIRLRAHKGVSAEFVALFLKSRAYWAAIADEVAGIAVPNVSASKLRSIQIPVPPAAEQRRIVAKVEELLAHVNAARERLERVPAILKRFRQAVLAAACSDGEEVELDSILDEVRYGTAVKCNRDAKGTPVLRIPNVVAGSIGHDDMKYGHLDAKERGKLLLKPGDLLMIRSNGSVGLVGRTALATEKEQGFAYAGYLMRLRLKAEALPQYVNLALQTLDAREQIERPARSTSGVHNINSQEVKALRVRLPPPAAQARAVQGASAMFALADLVKRRVALGAGAAGNLTQAILVKAFRGELVPTEAEVARREGREYEPASALLERIKKEREAAISIDSRKR